MSSGVVKKKQVESTISDVKFLDDVKRVFFSVLDPKKHSEWVMSPFEEEMYRKRYDAILNSDRSDKEKDEACRKLNEEYNTDKKNNSNLAREDVAWMIGIPTTGLLMIAAAVANPHRVGEMVANTLKIVSKSMK